MPIRLLIADDHAVLRAGLIALLNFEPGMEVVAEAGDVETTVALALEKRPDIILMDISMPESGGLEATRRIRKLAPEVRMLILTAHEDKSLMKEAIRSGAMGYILKRAVKTDLINAIHTVMRGELYIHPAMAKLLFTNKLEPVSAPQVLPEPLTYREIEVLKLIARGYTNQQTADMLSISVRTVEYHRGNVMGKLNLRTRAELMKYSEQKGWL